jgi:hypothetical protein
MSISERIRSLRTARAERRADRRATRGERQLRRNEANARRLGNQRGDNNADPTRGFGGGGG